MPRKLNIQLPTSPGIAYRLGARDERKAILRQLRVMTGSLTTGSGGDVDNFIDVRALAIWIRARNKRQ